MYEQQNLETLKSDREKIIKLGGTTENLDKLIAELEEKLKND